MSHFNKQTKQSYFSHSLIKLYIYIYTVYQWCPLTLEDKLSFRRNITSPNSEGTACLHLLFLAFVVLILEFSAFFSVTSDGLRLSVIIAHGVEVKGESLRSRPSRKRGQPDGILPCLHWSHRCTV